MYESLRLRNNDLLVIKVVHETYNKPLFNNLNGSFRDNRSDVFEKLLQRIAPGFKYHVEEPFGEDVIDFTEKHRNVLKKMVREAKESKIMITHSMTGERTYDNDDMRETTFFLGRREFKKKAIVITKTINSEYKDSPFNLGLSLGVLSKNKEGTFMVFEKESRAWEEVE
jgi:hypothetical protein